MRIGVIDAIAEDLLTVSRHNRARQLRAVDVQLIELGEAVDLKACDPARRQDARGRQARLQRRKADRELRRVLGKVVGDALQLTRLGGKVQLLQHHGANLGKYRIHAVIGRHPVQHLKDTPERAQIDAHDLLDVGILHFDRDLDAVFGASAVDLTNRR